MMKYISTTAFDRQRRHLVWVDGDDVVWVYDPVRLADGEVVARAWEPASGKFGHFTKSHNIPESTQRKLRRNKKSHQLFLQTAVG